LQDQLSRLTNNSVLALDGKLALTEMNGYATALFTGVNVQVVNGLGKTDTVNGVGNLIVGYNADRTALWPQAPSAVPYEICSLGAHDDAGECAANAGVWAVNHKSGSHNIVGGEHNAYSSFGGLVVGSENAITNAYAAVTGGQYNLSRGVQSSVSGGSGNTSSGGESSVAGGAYNTASGSGSSVSGGNTNTASGMTSSVSGGFSNTAGGDESSVSGGLNNTAAGATSAVSGGEGRSAPNPGNWSAGGLSEPK
jgi:hypothetical protein